MATLSSSPDSVKTSTLVGLLILFLPIMGLVLVWFLISVRRANALSNPWFWISAVVVLALWSLHFYLRRRSAENRKGWPYPILFLVGIGGSYLSDVTIADGIVNRGTPVFAFFGLVPLVGIVAVIAFVLVSRLVKHTSGGPGP